jgi:hypothetical protein
MQLVILSSDLLLKRLAVGQQVLQLAQLLGQLPEPRSEQQ